MATKVGEVTTDSIITEIEIRPVDNGFRVQFTVDEKYMRQVRDGKYKAVPGEFVEDTQTGYRHEVYQTVDQLCARITALFKSKRAKK